MKSTRISKSQYAVNYPNITILVSKDHDIKKSEGWSFRASIINEDGTDNHCAPWPVKFWTKGAALAEAAVQFAPEIAEGQRLEAQAKAAAKSLKKVVAAVNALEPIVVE